MKRLITAGALILVVLITFSGCDIIGEILGIDFSGDGNADQDEFVIEVDYAGPDFVSSGSPLIVAVVNVNSESGTDFAYKTVTSGYATVSIFEYDIPRLSTSGYAIVVLHDLDGDFSSNQEPEPGEPMGWYKMGAPGNLFYSPEPDQYTRVYPGDSVYVEFDPPPPPEDSFEPDGSASQANLIGVDTSEQHTLVPGDQDWHYFNAIAGVSYTIDTFAGPTGETTDTVLSVYEADGATLIDENNDYAGQFSFSQVQFVALADGPVYLKVTGFQDGVTGEYEVGVYQDSLSTTSLSVDTLYAGSLDSTTEYDWFTINVTSGTTNRLETTNTGYGNDADTIIAVFDDAFSLIATNDDGPTVPYSLVDFVSGYSGTYYVRVHGSGVSTGYYDLTYTVPTLLDVTIQ